MLSPTLEQRIALQGRPTDQRQVMFQAWRELLFLHWSLDPELIQQTLPPGLTVDTFDGRAWIGIVPFYMRAIRPVYLPPLPRISYFLEVNVRTYVHSTDGTPGVWFYSLDANRWLAVQLARTFFHLPYFEAGMRAPSFPPDSKRPIDYRSLRKGEGAEIESRFEYQGGAVIGTAEPGSFEFFLVERYILFAYNQRNSRLFSGRVHHAPYELCEVELNRYDDRLIRLAGFDLGGRPAEHVAMSHGVDVDVFPVKEIP